ncbi:MAG: helix-turn-helix domain-containing protein [Pseudolabrys sp.]
MKQRRRIYYSVSQRSEIWDRWQAGEPMSSIGRGFDRESLSVFSVISPTGGIRPPDRHRAKQALSPFEREEISRGLSTQRSLRLIARRLRRSASTISGEVSRNGGAARYRAAGSGSGGLGSGAATQAVQGGLPSIPEPDGGGLALSLGFKGANLHPLDQPDLESNDKRYLLRIGSRSIGFSRHLMKIRDRGRSAFEPILFRRAALSLRGGIPPAADRAEQRPDVTT